MTKLNFKNYLNPEYYVTKLQTLTPAHKVWPLAKSPTIEMRQSKKEEVNHAGKL